MKENGADVKEQQGSSIHVNDPGSHPEDKQTEPQRGDAQDDGKEADGEERDGGEGGEDDSDETEAAGEEDGTEVGERSDTEKMQEETDKILDSRDLGVNDVDPKKEEGNEMAMIPD